MKKRILSCLMALALCLTLLPTAALAEETEGTAQTPPAVEESTDPANGEVKQENQSAAPEQEKQPAEQEEQQEDSASKQDGAVANLQAMIDALPDAEALDGMDDEDAMAVYEAFQAVCDAYYETLNEEQQAQLKNTEKLAALSAWFSQPKTLAEGTEHTDHSICGETGCTDPSHALQNGETWKGVSSLAEIEGAGHYFLTQNVTIDSTWEPESGVVLCLNGYSITANGEFNAITIQDGRTFTLCDCKGSGSTGMVTHSNGTGSGVYVNGTFNMYGGSISGNSAIYGGGVYVNGTFNMYGGSITKNTVSDTKGIYYGGGVYVSESATFTVSGTVNITGNTAENGNANNVFLPFVDQSLKSFTIGEAGLAPGSSIGVATDVAPNPGYYLTVATLSEGAAYIEGTIISDRTGGYAIKAKGNNINLYNGLPHEHYRCNGKDAETGGDKCTGIGGHTEEGVLSFKAWTNPTKLPTTSGNYYLTGDVTLDSAWSIKSIGGEQVRFVLCLNGHSIRLKDGVNDHVINVGKGGTLALCDCNGSKAGNGIISGGTKASGVYIDNVGAFVMYGGSISGNGTGVTNKELFQMYGGSITGNDCGVENLTGTFTMYDGSITGNQNTKNNSYGKGGGVCVESGAFDMHGGSITGNAVSGSDQSYGGGVYVNGGATFTMSGGSITGNTAGDYGGGVYTGGTFIMSGDAVISDNTAGSKTSSKASNVYLESGKSITVGGKLTGGDASIGVTTANAPAENSYLTIANGVNYTLTADDLIAFASDSAYGKLLNGNSVIFTNGDLHIHAVCGESCTHNGAHSNAVWKPISNESELRNAKAGHYYLTTGIQLTGRNAWTPMDGVVLCLNGNSITVNGSFTAINVLQNYTFTLTDCKGTGRITRTQGGTGRGVYMSGDTFNMYGGEITGNLVHAGDGGGVRVKSGTFNMYGGSITKNTAREVSNRPGGNGGGVCVDDSGTFNMYGGSITKNAAREISSGTGGTGGNGGGVYVNGGTFKMNGTSKVTGNTASNGNGGGVYVDGNANMTVSGGAQIQNNWKNGTLNADSGAYEQGDKGSANNLYLYNGATVAIDTLAETARIGITTEKTPTAGTPVPFATGAAGDLDYATIFTPDAKDKSYVVNKEGTDLVLSAHQHSWTYALSTDGQTITAKCSKSGCPAPDGGSVTINKPAHTTYGDGKEAAATVASTLDSSITKSTITYKKGNDIRDTAPTDAGTYTASITVGEGENAKTASVEYTIAKATPRVMSWMGYPRGWTFKENTPIADPTELLIANGTFEDVTRFEWYNASKNADDTYTEGTKLDGNPTDAGDYIIKAVFEESNNVYAAVDALGLTIRKAQDANNGVSIEVPLTVYPVSAEYVYEVNIAKALENIPHGGGLEPNTAYGGIFINSSLVRSAKWDNGKLKVTMKPLAGISGTTLGSITVNLTSKNYTVVPVVVNITLQPKREVPDISVSMDNWTYGENAKTPRYTMMAGVEAEVTYAAQGSSDFSTTVPTDAGNYTVKVQYETAIEIHTGTANFTIAPKTLTKDDLTYSGPITKVYDSSTNAPSGLTVSVKHDSLVGSDTLAVSGTLKYNSANVNEANQIIFTPTAITTGNYALAATEVLTITGATITKAKQAPLTVTSTTATYGEDLALTTDGGSGDGTVTYTVTDGTGKATIVDGSKLHPTKAGTVSVTAAKSGGDNYEDVTSAAKEITIGLADYTGTASKTINIVKGRSTAQTGTLTAADFFPEGQMPADAAIASVTPGYGTMMVGVTVNAEAGRALEYHSNTNITATEDETYTVTIAATNYKDITATLTFHPTDKLVQDGFKFENGSVTKTYGDEDFTLTTTGKVEGSTVTYESSKPEVATVDADGKVTIKGAGTAVITAKASATEDYDEAAATCTLTVEKKPIAIPTADATVFTYNGTEQTYALAEDGAYTITGNKQTNANETGYSVTVALKDTANTQWASEDDDTADKTYKFVIKKAVITVKAKDQSAYVGDKAPALGADSYTVSGLVGEEKLTIQPTVKYVGADGKEITPDMTKTGEVKILAGGAAASDNYTIRYEDGKLTINTRPSGGGGSSRPSTHPVKAEVSKDPDGTVSLSKTNAAKGDKVTITVKPERHYEVDEVIVRDSKGKQLAVKDNGDGTFTFEMPADKVTVEPTFSWVNPFADVADSAYYVRAVEWMLKREVTQGTAETTFSPNLNCTRAQIVTFLWRAAGSPEPKGTAGFADVPAGSYYAKAVAWAVENGITGGTGDGLFSPDAACTRAQSAAFLYRAAGSPAVSGSAGFSDVAADAYYAQAVAWAKEHGITGGIGGGLFGSANDCTRAQIAAFLWRLYAKK